MTSLFAGGQIIDLVLLVVAIEAAAALVFKRTTGRGPSLNELIQTLLPGICLLAALRVALSDTWRGWIAVWLLLAFVAHLHDLLHRWHR